MTERVIIYVNPTYNIYISRQLGGLSGAMGRDDGTPRGHHRPAMRVGGRYMVIRGHEEHGTARILRCKFMTPRSSPLSTHPRRNGRRDVQGGGHTQRASETYGEGERQMDGEQRS